MADSPARGVKLDFGYDDFGMSLETEMATYNAKLPEWTEHEGKFVLIHGTEIVDFYSSYDDAIKIGYSKFGLEPFLVKKVNRMEQVQFVSRLVAPRCLPRAG